MKRKTLLLAVGIVLLFAFNVGAVDWKETNQATVAWDPVTQLWNGDPIPSGDNIFYRLYIRKDGESEYAKVDDTTKTEYTLTFIEEGKWAVGVHSIRIPEGGTEEYVSTITWSTSEDISTVPSPFGFTHYLGTKPVTGLVPK